VKRIVRWLYGLSDKRSQHLVYMAHIWMFAPFLVLWLRDKGVREVLGERAVSQLEPVIAIVVLYLAVRTWIAYKDPPKLPWEYAFPPVDVALITLILCLSHRGPMSNISLLYFLPIIGAAGTLNVGWSATVGLLVAAGTVLSASFGLGVQHNLAAANLGELWQANALNIVFRLYFVVVISSLMTYQALIAAGLKQRLAVAADRNRIAADMHDGVQGHLITIASQLELLQKVAERDPARAAELAREARELARTGADELRFLVQRMRAPALADGFLPALKQYAHNICSRHGIELEFAVEGEPRTLPPEHENALFRIAQEALTNAVKHSSATTLSVLIEFRLEEVRLQVRDNGCGFPSSEDRGGVGLLSMKERAQSVEGSLTIDCAEGAGTHIAVHVPTKL
jgi:signal transduction histidine kinase